MSARCAVASATIRGVDPIPVTVEVSIGTGMPGMSIVGMADTAVQEARERVRAAIRACGFSVPNKKMVINLAPSALKKGGSGFDLPIAIGVLVASGQVPAALLDRRLFVGELSLDGSVRTVTGLLACGICAYQMGYGLVSSGDEVIPLEGLAHASLSDLGALVEEEPFHPVAHALQPRHPASERMGDDLGEVAGHELPKRALQIAAAGEHGLLMVGAPGAGKTMLASRIATILPLLSEQEMLEAAAIHSVVGEDTVPILQGERPFRHPHHSATMAGLVGGGNPIRPGEISLAHRGTLFLDELPEFKPSVLQALRQPIESGEVRLTRSDGSVVFPARFMLIAAANPCPCGYLGDPDQPCECTIPQIRAYQARVGGPLIDRFDMQIDMRRPPAESLLGANAGSSSADLREGVLRAREFASWRRSREEGEGERLGASGSPSSPDKLEAQGLGDEERSFLMAMAEAEKLSGRAIMGSLRVARTIADLAQSDRISCEHLAEALAFRKRVG